MVYLDEDPVDLIRATINEFAITPDKDSLTRIGRHLHDLAGARRERINSQHAQLAALSRRLNASHGKFSYEEERHDAGRHATAMLRMDTEKFRIAKHASDAEVEAARLDGELAALKQQLQTLEREGVEGGAAARRGEDEDEIVLQLQLYRSLGIDATRDPTTREYTRAVIRNPSRGDVSVVDLDENTSKSDRVKMIWEGL